MAGSFVSLHYHVVFSTKDRLPQITEDRRERLWRYMAGVLRKEKGMALSIGGTEDHVHMLISLHQDHSVSGIMRTLKSVSSGWVHQTYGESAFAWQEGYAAFTVNCAATDMIRKYIENQANHHKRRSFQEELLAFLKRHKIKYDERYIWK